MKCIFLALFVWMALPLSRVAAQEHVVWKIGQADNAIKDLALPPGEFDAFLKQDFGWEDRFFVIGQSDAKKEWPHVLPGIKDKWGGSSWIAGVRTHVLNVLFDLKEAPVSDEWKLVIDFFDSQKKPTPLMKVTVNGQTWKFPLPPGTGDLSAKNTTGHAYVHRIALPAGLIRPGGNELSITSLLGSWCAFDRCALKGPTGLFWPHRPMLFCVA